MVKFIQFILVTKTFVIAVRTDKTFSISPQQVHFGETANRSN